MSVPRSIQSSIAPGRLTRLYVVSLSTIAVLAIVGQVIIQRQLSDQAKDAAIISTAQNRQQLCEALLKTSLAYRMSRGDDRALARQELAQMTQTWENSQTDLRQQMQTTLSAAEFAEIEPMFGKLKPLGQQVLMAAKVTLMDNVENTRPLLKLTSALSVPRVMKVGTAFNQEVDQIISWYGRKAEQGVARLQLMEFGLLSLTLGTLLLEGCLVFRPAIAKLKASLQALEKSLHQLTQEQEKSEKLLLNILPESIADRLKASPSAIADGFADATVLFADIVGFTELSGRLTPQELVKCLNEIFSCFDHLAEKHGLEKIKTIGDAYMVVGGLPDPRPDHAISIAHMALDMQVELQKINQSMGEQFNIRIGINSGPVVAGVIGIKKFIYDLWGDTVNIASRMESHGDPGEIHISESTYRKLDGKFDCQPRGKIQVKGKGEMTTYWLRSRNESA